jgi:hypothetical protein
MKRTMPKEGLHSHAIRCESKRDGKFLVPVIDVRDGEKARQRAKEMQRQNGSKFFGTSYSLVGRPYN